MSNMFLPRVDWMNVVEAAYAAAGDDATWGARVFDASKFLFDECPTAGLIAIRHDATCTSFAPVILAGASKQFGPMLGDTLQFQGDVFRELFYPRALVSTHLELDRRITREAQDALRALRHAFGCVDVFGLTMEPEPGLPMVLCRGYDKAIRLTPHDRYALTQIAIHVEAGLRLRLRPENVTAVLSSDGKVLDRTPGAPESSRLASHVKNIERARTRKQRVESKSLTLWTALIDGRMSLVERTDGPKRHYLVLENAPARQQLRALTSAELEVLALAARGLPAKLIAYALGISAPTVSSRLANAASKVGLATRLDLVRVAAMLTRDPRAGFPNFALTVTESQILELLARGLSNREIATIRNRSVRTIANQVAGLLRKTDSPSRRALAARAVGGAAVSH